MDDITENKITDDATAQARPATTTKPITRSDDSEANIKETIESIIVAFILAFVFRAFVVEAFVIPTGSMAPTLLGAHMRFRCPDCGYRFDVNYSTPNADDMVIPDRAYGKTYSIFCPNCGYRMPRRSDDPMASASSPPINYGDRILVLKYLYLFQDPRRWDVVVFKSPSEPDRYDYQQNYIKRLVGRPNETVMILDGDIYVSPHSNRLEDFVIQTKPRDVQDALWRVVYDNDFYPQGRSRVLLDEYGQPFMRRGEVRADPPFVEPWTPQPGESGWEIGNKRPEARTFRFNNLKSAGSIFFDASANPNKRALTDWLAYDTTANQSGTPGDYENDSYTAQAIVSDLKLSFFYQRKDGDGPLTAQLSKYDDRFIAEVNGGKISLRHVKPNGSETVIRNVNFSHDWSRPTQVELINVDYQVTVRIDGKDVIVTTPDEYHPDLQARLRDYERDKRPPKPSIRIACANQVAELTHVGLWRDIYYLNRGSRIGRTGFWGSPAHFPENLIELGPEEYFCCGDNSPISLDGRWWHEEINLPDEDLKVESGRVPKRFLLGKAFFVYWPAGYRPIDPSPSIIPNFGDMRFIH
ncbi:MAG TPA: S26 family signal peptidase [Tepidisphaeraceae bacterium]|nr:S26 family signal peptidase [Tepidisphaeraceae bacterium]